MPHSSVFLSINDYLSFEKKQYPFYYGEINTQAKSVGKISLQKRLCIAIPIHTSERHIDKALEFYAQQRLSPEVFELCLLLNRRPNDPSFASLRTTIREFK